MVGLKWTAHLIKLFPAYCPDWTETGSSWTTQSLISSTNKCSFFNSLKQLLIASNHFSLCASTGSKIYFLTCSNVDFFFSHFYFCSFCYPYVYLQVIPCTASSSKALDLKGGLEGGRNSKARCHHHVPAAIQTWPVILWVIGSAHYTSVNMQESTATYEKKKYHI